MPIYGQQCLNRKCGHVFDDVRSMSQCDVQPKCPKCGGRTDKEYGKAAWNGERPEQVSDALGVHPDQIPEMVAKFPHHRFNKKGQMLFRTNSELQRVLKDIGYVDKNRH